MVERAPIAPLAEKVPLLEAHAEKLLQTAEQNHRTEAHLREEQAEQAQQVETARSTVEATANTLNPLEQYQANEAAAAAPAPSYVNRELKDLTLRREIKLIQRQESTAARALSRVVHQPAVRLASEAAGKTVSRPSGLLGAGILAFVGSSAYLYLTSHYGFSYNYFVLLALFAGGFGLGLGLELVVWLVAGRQRSRLSV